MSFDRGAPAVWFVEITLDSETLRLCNAFEPIDFDGETYEPFGDRLTPPSDIDRTRELKSQKFSLSLDSSRQTDNDDPVGIILDSNWRRRPVRVRYAVGDVDADGFDFSDPEIIVDESGRLKDAEDTIGAGETPQIEIEIESGALIFLERRNQTRSPANQRAAFPGDAFFDYALKLDGVVLPWRTKHAKNGKVQITYDVEGAAPREMLIGRGVTKGSFVFGATGGQQRKYWAQVYALADHECQALEEIWINGTPVLNGVTLSHGVRTALSAFNSGGTRLWATWYDGRHDQTADSYLISLTSGQPLAWTSNHRGRGVSYVIIEHLWDSDLAESFSYEFQLAGAKIYSERLDTTAGGSGAHRWNDPDTWEFSTNAADALRHFLRGRVLSPTSSAMWFGVGAELAFLDPYATYAAQAAHADENVALKLGGTQKRYEANGWISADTDHKTNLRKLADCMVADAVDEGSRISIRLSEPQTPVIELTDADLVSDEETVIGANARADDVVNRIEGRFQDPANKYQAVDYAAVSDAGFEEIDGAELTETFNQPLEISEERAQRKATLFLNKRRRTVELEEHFGPKAKDIRPGDWITRSSALRGFPGGKLFIADEVRRYIDGTVRLILLEVDPGELVWNEANAELTPATDDPEFETLALDVPVIAVSAISVAAGDVSLPAIRFTITDHADAMGDEVICEFGIWNGLGGGSAGIAGPSSFIKIPGNVATFDGLVGLLPGTGYAFRFQARDGERFSAWSSFGTLTTSGTYQAGRSAIADAIVGQGWGATAPQSAVDNSLVPIGVNALVDYDFRFGTSYWRATPQSGSLSEASNETLGIRRRTLTGSGVTVGHWIQLDSFPDRTRFACRPGDVIEASAFVSASNCSAAQIFIQFYDAAGASAGFSSVVSFTPGSAVASINDFVRGSVIAAAPSGTAFAMINVRGVASTSAPVLHVAFPMLARGNTGQTTPSAWNPGFAATPGADPTGANIAAGFTGQGWGATASQPDAGNTYVPAGANSLADTEFRAPFGSSNQWATTGDSGSGLSSAAETRASGLRVFNHTRTGMTVGHYLYTLTGSSGPNKVFCQAGDRVGFRVLVGGVDVSQIHAFVIFRDSAGVNLGSAITSISSGIPTGAGEETTFHNLSAYGDAPANTAYAQMLIRATASSATPTLRIAKPFCGIMPPGQIVIPPYTRGFDGVPGADPTGANTAAAIVGQGWGATAPQSSVDNALVYAGTNACIDTGFRAGTAWWSSYSNSGSLTQSAGVGSGIRYGQIAVNSYAAGGGSYAYFAGFPQRTLRVSPGDRVEGRALIGGTSGLSGRIWIAWLNEAGTWITTSSLQSQTLSLAGGGAQSTYHEVGGFTTAPANAAWAVLYFQISGGSAGNVTFRVAAPFLSRARDGQTAATPLFVTNDYQPGADPTGGNIAAGYTGQSSYGTASAGRGNTASRPASPPNWSTYVNTETNMLQQYVPSVGWVNIASLDNRLAVSVSAASRSAGAPPGNTATTAGVVFSVAGGTGPYQWEFSGGLVAPSTARGTGTSTPSITYSKTITASENSNTLSVCRFVDANGLTGECAVNLNFFDNT